MTVFKPLLPSSTLRFYRAVHGRADLPDDATFYHQSLQKGYDGEEQWATYLKELPEDMSILFDLTFEVNQSTIQIDALLILQNKLVLFEVKNFQGDFSVSGEKWYSPTHKEIKNPLNQIKRAEPLFHQFLQKHQLNIPFDYYLVFTHPTFVLYGSPHYENVIFPGQIPKFLNNLKQQTYTPQRNHTKIIDTLLSNHTDRIQLLHKPEYRYEQMERGLYCGECGGRMRRERKGSFICFQCHQIKTTHDIVMSNIHDYITLFPERKVTRASIFEWFGGEVSVRL